MRYFMVHKEILLFIFKKNVPHDQRLSSFRKPCDPCDGFLFLTVTLILDFNRRVINAICEAYSQTTVYVTD